MVGKSKYANKAQKKRMELIKSEVGCVACMQHGHFVTPCDVHHLIEGSRRRGHDYTVALCAWHHRGVDPLPGQELQQSLARSPAMFHDVYGDDEVLLENTNNRLAHLKSLTVSAL